MTSFIHIKGPEFWPCSTVGNYVMIHLLRTMITVFGAKRYITKAEYKVTVNENGRRIVNAPRSRRWPFLMSSSVLLAVKLLEKLGVFTPYDLFITMNEFSHGDISELADDFVLQLLLCAFFKLYPYLTVASS